MINRTSYFQRGFHEWPLHDRRSRRTVELVVTAHGSEGAKPGSVVFESANRPRRVVPLAFGLSAAILLAVHTTGAAFSLIGPPPLADFQVIDSASAMTAR